MIIDGRKIAAEIITDLQAKFTAQKVKKFMGAALVGPNPASENFLKQKAKVAAELGIEFRLYKLSSELTTDNLRQEIGRLAGVKSCGGFIVQLPLPKDVNLHYAMNAIPKEKDVDVLSEPALGAFYTGRSKILPPSVATVAELLARYVTNLRNSAVVVIGAGFLIGRPVGFWLQNRVAELTVFDEHAPYLREKLKDADVVVSGAGRANLFSAADLKSGAVVIDFGFSQIETKDEQGEMKKKIVGDFVPPDPRSHKLEAINYTPVPGGTGPILVAKLFENFYLLNS